MLGVHVALVSVFMVVVMSAGQNVHNQGARASSFRSWGGWVLGLAVYLVGLVVPPVLYWWWAPLGVPKLPLYELLPLSSAQTRLLSAAIHAMIVLFVYKLLRRIIF